MNFTHKINTFSIANIFLFLYIKTMNNGEQKMTTLNLTEKEEIVLEVCLNSVWETNTIFFKEIAEVILKDTNFNINTLKGVFGSLEKKNLFHFDQEVEGDNSFVFSFPCMNEYDELEIDTIEKVKQYFEENKTK